MLNDHAVIVSEVCFSLEISSSFLRCEILLIFFFILDCFIQIFQSSLGAVYALRKRLPALTNGDSADVHMDTVNGNLRLRMGELSPRRSGDGRGIIVPVPQGWY